MKKEQISYFLPLLWAFLLVSLAAILFKSYAEKAAINTAVVIGANLILFVLAVIGLNMQIKSLSNINPHAMVRGVMGSVVLKLFVLGTAAFIYLYNAGEAKSVNALFIGMGLYIVYTWLEVRISMQLKPPAKNGSK